MRTSHRPVALAVVAAALLVLTAACGGGGSKKSSSNPTPAPLTTAKAQALAKAAVLTAADMPGYKAEESKDDPNDKATDQRIAACLGTTKPTYLAENPGMTFTKGDLEVDSSADVAPSVATAKAEVAAFTSPKLKDCVKQEFAKLLADSHGVITAFEITPQSSTVTGADETFAYTFDLRASVAGQQLHFNGLDVGALVGQVEVDLSVFDQSGSSTFTVEQANALLQRAVDRTKAAA
jgi:hypothetical protein